MRSSLWVGGGGDKGCGHPRSGGVKGQGGEEEVMSVGGTKRRHFETHKSRNREERMQAPPP